MQFVGRLLLVFALVGASMPTLAVEPMPFAGPTPSDEATPPSETPATYGPTPAEQVRNFRSTLWRNKGRICAYSLLFAALHFSGYYMGVRSTMPSSAMVLVSPEDAPLDDSRFTVVEQRQVYAVVDRVVKDGTGEVVPGSDGTVGIFDFRGSLFRLDTKGRLSVYRPSAMWTKWVTIETPAFKQVMSLEQTIVGITEEGEVFSFLSSSGRIGFDESKANVGGQPIGFTSMGKGFRKLASVTPEGFHHPETVVALGDDALIFKNDGSSYVAKKGTAEREALNQLESRISN